LVIVENRCIKTPKEDESDSYNEEVITKEK